MERKLQESCETHWKKCVCFSNNEGKLALHCGFEDENICGYEQDNSTDWLDWVRNRGATPSSRTGPSEDHTCASKRGKSTSGSFTCLENLTTQDHFARDNQKFWKVNVPPEKKICNFTASFLGHYMYVEASTKAGGHNAILLSPRYHGLGPYCVEFYYHMYGHHIGTLNVYTKVLRKASVPVFHASKISRLIKPFFPHQYSVPVHLRLLANSFQHGELTETKEMSGQKQEFKSHLRLLFEDTRLVSKCAQMNNATGFRVTMNTCFADGFQAWLVIISRLCLKRYWNEGTRVTWP